MNRTFVLCIAVFIAVLGIALMGGDKLAVAGDCCAPACCAAPAADCCAPASCHPGLLAQVAARRCCCQQSCCARVCAPAPCCAPAAGCAPAPCAPAAACCARRRLAAPRLAVARAAARPRAAVLGCWPGCGLAGAAIAALRRAAPGGCARRLAAPRGLPGPLRSGGLRPGALLRSGCGLLRSGLRLRDVLQELPSFAVRAAPGSPVLLR